MLWDFTFPAGTVVRALSKARLHLGPPASGPITLFVPGGFHGAWSFAPYLRMFAAAGVGAAALDLRGHGGLPQDAAFIGAGVADMAADVAEAAAALGGRVILAGHSLGALVAMAAAREVSPVALVMLAPAPPGNIPKMHALPPFPEDAAIAPPPDARARRWLLQGLAPDAAIAPYLARLCPESPALLNDRYGGRVTVDPAWVRGPRLCMIGALDASPMAAPGESAAAAGLYQADTLALPGGHCFMLTPGWEDGGAHLLAWLARRGLASTP